MSADFLNPDFGGGPQIPRLTATPAKTGARTVSTKSALGLGEQGQAFCLTTAEPALANSQHGIRPPRWDEPGARTVLRHNMHIRLTQKGAAPDQLSLRGVKRGLRIFPTAAGNLPSYRPDFCVTAPQRWDDAICTRAGAGHGAGHRHRHC